MDPEWKRFDDALTVAGEKNITELEKLVNMIRTGIQGKQVWSSIDAGLMVA